MACFLEGCQEDDGFKKDPCTVCGRLIHHMCAIGVYEGSDSALNESPSCVRVVYPEVSPPASASATGKRTATPGGLRDIWEGTDSDFTPSPDLSGVKDDDRVVKRRRTAPGPAVKASKKKTPLSTQTNAGKKKAAPPSEAANSLFTAAPVPLSAPPMSDLGVPLTVKHARKAGTTDDIWDLIHTLDVPYKKQNPWRPSTQLYRNICLLCCDTIKSRSKTNPYCWEAALRNTKNASNAKDHIKLKHADHPLAIHAEQSATDKSRKDVESAEVDSASVLDLTRDPDQNQTSITSPDEAILVSGGSASKPFFRVSEKTLNVLVSKLLISQGLPYTLCESAAFKDLIRAATGNPAFQVLGRDRHDRLLNGHFQLFCELVGESLSTEYEKACNMTFLNLIHDIWTSCGKDNIVGASVAFIDSLWRFCFIAVLVCVKNDGHNAPAVAKVIESAFKSRFNLDIRSLTRYTMSDTTPSAKNVADHIDTEQDNCSMHLLNLCIGYGIGLKDNIQTTTVWNEFTGSWDKIATTVTPGGALYEGGDVIHKIRNLNNHFRSPKQRNALKKIQEALSYPELEPMTEQDVRVAYTCKLIRRSVVNYGAFDAYFQSTKDSTSSWSALTAKDWTLAVEMEAATNFIANLTLVEVQSENLVSSYMVMFRRLAENKLKSFKFEAMAIEAPGAKDASEASHRRVTRTRDQFSDAGKTCLRRTLMQLQARFPKVTTESMTCVLLDPRTKSSAKKIAAVGAPIRATKTRDELKETEIIARADAVLREWIDLEQEWLEAAQRQSPKIKIEDLSKDMSIDAQSGMHYALLGLYKHIDVLKWF
ncbi:uncharacterized protein PITG_11219 [Phytophthora infestans T30-4]|uniref:HAT C-terminal dimerisation domain-containing protein n=1 Tax=Phytophthora infestans (strain T30-4) TaxID=403677 RepID=D0NGG7_PHYIT|nr:uncharacterized protein PITG_11219 [Phytophthora infestans T30-4]EEY57368.1 conserved hypothetical protein [Phytophthora infestans T30-4]|eukprot:XP_002901978.1 conserved hypothetical protein [Phytophthora infestans T30-4]